MGKLQDSWERDICPECGCYVYYDMREYHLAWHKTFKDDMQKLLNRIETLLATT